MAETTNQSEILEQPQVGTNDAPEQADNTQPDANIPADVPTSAAPGAEVPAPDTGVPAPGSEVPATESADPATAPATGQNAPGAAEDAGEPEAEATPEGRRALLTRKLVTEYKEKKEEKGGASLDSKDIQHSDSLAKNAKADSIAEYLGYGSTAGAATSALGAYGTAGILYAGGSLSTGIAGSIGGITGGKEGAANAAGEYWNTTKQMANTVINNQTSKDVFESIGVAGNISGTIGSGIKTCSNIYRARKDHNRYKRAAARRRAAAGAFSTAAEVTGGLSRGANLGLFGKRATVKGSSSQKKGGAFDIASGTAGFISNILDYSGNKAEKEGHKQTAEDTQKYANDNAAAADTSLSASRDAISGFKDKKVSELSDEEKDRLKAARQQRHTAKAQKYAMAQAAQLHKTRSEESSKGLLGMIGGGLGFLGSGLTGLSKILNKTTGALGMLGTAFSALAGITKAIGGGKEFLEGKKEKQKLVADKHDIVDQYLNGKIERIRKQADEMKLEKGEPAMLGTRGKSLTDEEAKRIAIMRLGIEIPGSTQNIPDEVYNNAFKVITEKRANNILKSSGEEKEKMLNSLGLDNSATFEDVVSALGAD